MMSISSIEASPPAFRWGVATSSYQIEGAAGEDGRGESIWDVFCRTPGKVLDGASGEVACDHYRRWQQDLDLMERLGIEAYRFSIAWPRLFREGTGRLNEKGLDFYERLVDGLLARGIEPHVTLYHWDLPQKLQDEGGWPERRIVEAFVAYADAVTKRLGERVVSYATFNEPWCSAFLGYYIGEHAPGLRDRALGLQAAHHLLLAHGCGLEVMRGNAPRSRHGIVLNLNPTYPATGDPRDAEAARRFDGFFNRWYLDPIFKGEYPQDAWTGYGADVPEVAPGDLEVISRPIDFLGVNYYSRVVVADEPRGEWPSVRAAEFEAERTDMGWEVYPRGLTDLLVRLNEDYPIPPIFISENGAAYRDELVDGKVNDPARVRYLQRHIEAMQDAMRKGVDVRGYFAWSLMDNFEWAKGYSKRFGLVYVDYGTQERIPKASAEWYADFIQSHKRQPIGRQTAGAAEGGER
jgi:beta-glucosidase